MSLLSDWTNKINGIISVHGGNLPSDVLREIQSLRDEMEYYNYHGYDGQVVTFANKNVTVSGPDDVIPSSRRAAETALLSDFEKYQRGENA